MLTGPKGGPLPSLCLAGHGVNPELLDWKVAQVTAHGQRVHRQRGEHVSHGEQNYIPKLHYSWEVMKHDFKPDIPL